MADFGYDKKRNQLDAWDDAMLAVLGFVTKLLRAAWSLLVAVVRACIPDDTSSARLEAAAIERFGYAEENSQ